MELSVQYEQQNKMKEGYNIIYNINQRRLGLSDTLLSLMMNYFISTNRTSFSSEQTSSLLTHYIGELPDAVTSLKENHISMLDSRIKLLEQYSIPELNFKYFPIVYKLDRETEKITNMILDDVIWQYVALSNSLIGSSLVSLTNPVNYTETEHNIGKMRAKFI